MIREVDAPSPLSDWSDDFIQFSLTQATPSIVYNVPQLARTAMALREACETIGAAPLLCLKANRSARILQIFKNSDFGADVASAHESDLAMDLGLRPLSATGPALGLDDIKDIIEAGGTVYFDSVHQISSAVAAGIPVQDLGARVSLPGTYERFGLLNQELNEIERAGISFPAFHFHNGELKSLERLQSKLDMVDALLNKRSATQINLGGGFGVLSNSYPRLLEAFQIIGSFASRRRVTLALEFGKVAVARCGALVVTVLARKVRGDEQILVVDASAFDLLRSERTRIVWPREGQHTMSTTIVGTSCHDDDIFSFKSLVPLSREGDRLIFRPFGAYTLSIAGAIHGSAPPTEIFFEG
jgi:diaminopimelate decarboxylase